MSGDGKISKYFKTKFVFVSNCFSTANLRVGLFQTAFLRVKLRFVLFQENSFVRNTPTPNRHKDLLFFEDQPSKVFFHTFCFVISFVRVIVLFP